MKSFGHLFFSFVAILFVRSECCRAEVTNCTETKMVVKGNTIADCRESAAQYSDEKKYGDCIGVTAWMVNWARLESECNKSVMDKELDKRLLKLKTDSSQAEFKKEMKLQKAFLQGLSAHCEVIYGKCEGTMWSAPRAGCPGRIYALRFAQAEMINKGALSLPDVRKDFSKNRKQIPGPYLVYAKLLCEMPVNVWKGRGVPSNCQDRVLSSLEIKPEQDCTE